MRTIHKVTFFGSANGLPGEPNIDNARETAKLIAESKRTIVNGGGPGVMLAATEGAKDANGKSVVVYYKPELATNFKGERNAKNFADENHEATNYINRTKKLLELGDAYIIFNGGTGTISEFAMAWGLARLYFGHHKPLILFGQFWHEIISAFENHMYLRDESKEVYSVVNSPLEALVALEKYEKIIEKNRHEHAECIGNECDLLL